ncbi:Cof-type HAD-IIB family hydrolase [Bacillus solimangrovi]|uniref:Haloacid dehalogenase n=1 Tax=Bacillus solimangrovi TaxID=1305675 RepID=A0A1E5LFT9_9BACI|nr:Cof-type HAD-IIB family hydrolase [Bacillus solimangrovi]OEH92933.1 haloacid dehalogenase [Bacillus solimangrovi]
MIYRLLAINIDGTLLRSNGRLLRVSKEAIEFVKNKDVYVTLVTSRNFSSAKKVAKALKLDSLLITHSGAIVGSSLDNLVFARHIEEEQTFNVVQVLESFNCHIRLLNERYSIGNQIKRKNNLIAKTVLGTGDPLFYPIQFVDSLSDNLRDHPVSTPKIDVHFTEPEEMKEVAHLLTERFPEFSTNVVNANKLEITTLNVSKLNGLQVLGEQLGISLDEMVVIGDGIDDIPMISNVGLGVAMGNASTEVKMVADWVTRSNDQNGLAYMVKEHFRKQMNVKQVKENMRS